MFHTSAAVTNAAPRNTVLRRSGDARNLVARNLSSLFWDFFFQGRCNCSLIVIIPKPSRTNGTVRMNEVSLGSTSLRGLHGVDELVERIIVCAHAREITQGVERRLGSSTAWWTKGCGLLAYSTVLSCRSHEESRRAPDDASNWRFSCGDENIGTKL